MARAAAYFVGAAALCAIVALPVGLLLLGTASAVQASCASSSVGGGPVGPLSAGGVRAELMPLFTAAAGKYGLGPAGWSILAAINRVETDFGADLSTSSAGAVGWMQFMPATWAQYGITPSGAPAPDGPAGWNDPADAIYSAASYLRASGAPADWNTAIYAYNHAAWYVSDVESYAAQYRTAAQGQAAGGAGSIDQSSALAYINSLAPTQAGFAVVTAGGQVLAQHNGDMQVPGASITKAMLLVAYLQQLGSGPVPAAAAAHLVAMIEDSTNQDGSWVFAQVGAGAVERVAAQAGMTHFVLDTSDPQYTLGQSLVTALDQARLFARIDQLIPAGERQYGMGLLESISADERWGILDAGIGVSASKAGWKPEGSSWVVNQAGQLTVEGQTAGIAIVSDGDSGLSAGEQVMQTVASDLLPPGAASATTTAGVCASAAAAGPAPLTPGSVGKILPGGIAAAPADAPQAVKAMIAAGNQLISYPYSYGGGHCPAAMQIPPGPASTCAGQQENGAPGYDCSSSTSFVLWAGGFGDSLLGGQVPVAQTLAVTGPAGAGQWVTYYGGTSGGSPHAWIEVAGLVLDTVHGTPTTPGGTGPRWQTAAEAAFETQTGSFQAHHPSGL
ncbi:MAG: lytic murein transglycosylase [Solirubrobacteraceae bacterium]